VKNGVKKTTIIGVLSVAVATLTLVSTIACGGGSGGGSTGTTTPVTSYAVTYSGNTSTAGTVPLDSGAYQQGQMVTVLGNTGSLVKTGYTFGGWNTKADGSGTTFAAGQTFAMATASVTLYATWTANTTAALEWTWVAGASSLVTTSTYGTKGTAAAGNAPGGRYGAASCSDKNGHGWVFGGQGYDSTGANGYLGDLWKFDGTNWTWVSGSGTSAQAGVYGNKGQAASSTVPGARQGAAICSDKSGNLWLFGGAGYDSAGTFGYLNDLWKFDGTNWTWMSGSNLVWQFNSFGTKGVPAASNVPGWRRYPAAWIDASGNFWLFGGFGNGSATSSAYFYLNDLWKFDGTNWTWVSGANVGDQDGTYGTKGTPAAANTPGARNQAAAATDANGNLWLFGGAGLDSVSAPSAVDLNDLWKFDGTNWTWVSGSSTGYQYGTYGTIGSAATANIPGARWSPALAIDGTGTFWLFGGAGESSTSTFTWLNDLWKFDGTNWTWVSGSNLGNQAGTYGTKGTAAATNIPGGRANLASWMDSGGNLWLFGGEVTVGGGSVSLGFGDLWSIKP
jgi:uncharacterized repeat protein (TIGR02543 family)